MLVMFKLLPLIVLSLHEDQIVQLIFWNADFVVRLLFVVVGVGRSDRLVFNWRVQRRVVASPFLPFLRLWLHAVSRHPSLVALHKHFVLSVIKLLLRLVGRHEAVLDRFSGGVVPDSLFQRVAYVSLRFLRSHQIGLNKLFRPGLTILQ